MQRGIPHFCKGEFPRVAKAIVSDKTTAPTADGSGCGIFDLSPIGMDGGKAKIQTDKTDKPTFWKRKLQEYRKSGLSRRAFSEQNGVTKSTMDYWFARIRKGQKEKGLVEVKPTSVLIQNPSLQIVLADKYRIELHRGFDPILLAEVVKALESLK